jgi:phosphoserine phosphatase RsbU/P
MKILIADDDPVLRIVLNGTLNESGYEVIETCDGLAAWDALRQVDGPKIAILDWGMPGMDGTEVCRRAREEPRTVGSYLILLTARLGETEVAEGLDAGASDYLTKPFNDRELLARVRVGLRVLEVQDKLNRRVSDLEEALRQVKQLRELLPICGWCKKVRDDKNYWMNLESYFEMNSDIKVTTGICPDCSKRVAEEF